MQVARYLVTSTGLHCLDLPRGGEEVSFFQGMFAPVPLISTVSSSIGVLQLFASIEESMLMEEFHSLQEKHRFHYSPHR